LPPYEKHAHFASQQEAVRKDVERCFGVLQARFAIIRNSCQHWSMDVIKNIMFTCVILYNMILADEEDIMDLEDIMRELQENVQPMQRGLSFKDLMRGTREYLEDADTYYGLRGDLIEHLRALKGARLH
jgi:hypothetical protein